MIRFLLFFTLGALAVFAAGFLWTIGSDAARAVIVRRTKARAAKREQARGLPHIAVTVPPPKVEPPREPVVLYYAPQEGGMARVN